MICPVCQLKQLKSKIFIGGSTCTTMYCFPFYDKEGNCHEHDINKLSTTYTCSNGHMWSIDNKKHCPIENCEFNNNRIQTTHIKNTDNFLSEEDIVNLKQQLESENNKLIIF